MPAYKLTDADGYTRRGVTGETKWTVGAIVQPQGEYTGSPCGPGCLHAYISPEVAVLADQIHAGYLPGGRLWEIEGEDWQTDGLKRWTTAPVRVVREMEIPALTTEENIAWAICLAPHASTREWAVSWLTGRDRSERAAEAAWADAAAAAATWAARAARAADVAARASEAARAWASRAAASAASAAARAARAAAVVAVAAAEAHLIHSLTRARAILSGDAAAEDYDKDNR